MCCLLLHVHSPLMVASSTLSSLNIDRTSCCFHVEALDFRLSAQSAVNLPFIQELLLALCHRLLSARHMETLDLHRPIYPPDLALLTQASGVALRS